MSSLVEVFEQREVLGKNFRVYGSPDNILFLAKEVADWIEYSTDKTGQLLKAVDEDEKKTSPIFYSGQVRDMWFLTEDGLYEVLMQSTKAIAKPFKKKVKEILKTIRKTGKYEDPSYKMMKAIEDQGKKLAELAAIIEKRHKPFVDPRHMYDYARNEYARSTGDESSRGIGYAIKGYFGECPYSSEIKPLSVKDWVCRNIGGEVVQEFADAITDGLIVRTKAGRWVNLSGVFSNDVEIPKLYKEFNNECAYCGRTDNLVIEHINPQVKMSAIDPSKVDIIGNCVIACQCCNKAKNDTMPYKHWYNSDLPSYRQWREKKIDEHINDYQV